MAGDQVVEPARAHLMPYLAEAKQIAGDQGALATIISGAGPTLCALCDSQRIAEKTAAALVDFYQSKGLTALGQATTVAPDGARVIDVQ